MTAAVALPQRTRSHHPTTGHGASSHPMRIVEAVTSRRRRRVASVLVASVLSVGGLGAHAVLTDSSGGVPASAATGVGTAQRHVRAESGDSLWSIARQHRGEASMRDYVGALTALNGGSTEIEAGQLVTLP